MKFSEAIIKYNAYSKLKNKASSSQTYVKNVRQIAVFFRDCDIEAVSLQEIVDYMDLMMKFSMDRNSLVGKASSFKQFFTFFHKQGIIKFDPSGIPVPRYEQKFPKIIEEEDFNKILKALDSTITRNHFNKHRGKAFWLLLWDTGMRLNELRSLKVQDLDLKEMRAMIKTEKSRGVSPTRMIFWTKRTNQALKDYLEVRGHKLKEKGDTSDILFINAFGRILKTGPWCEAAIGQYCKMVSYKSGLGFIANPHRFRHRFGRNLAMKGANNSVISDMMGHSSMESTRIYTMMNPKMMEETYNKHFRV